MSLRAAGISLVLSALLSFCASKDGQVRVNWNLGGDSCARASVIFVRVALDGAILQNFECRDDDSLQGVTLPHVPPGEHAIAVTGLGLRNSELWSGQSEAFQVEIGAKTEVNVDLSRTAVENPLQPTTPAMRMLQETGQAPGE
jgi:hypothetical protein